MARKSKDKESFMSLYKYTPHNKDYKYDIITKCELWFSKVEHFNDPIDFNLAYKQQYSKSEIREYLKEFIKRNGAYYSNDLKKSLNLKESLRLYGNSKAFVANQNRLFKGFRKHFGILCMSENPESILMWAHYADKNKGIVYEFDYDLFGCETTKNPNDCPYCVEYPNNKQYELLSYTLQDEELKEQFIRLLTTKAIDWAYEKEVRFINLGKGDFNRKFDPKCLKSIIFGIKTKGEEIKKIKKLCKEHNLKHIKFKQAKLIDGRFEIEIVDID